MCCFQELQMRRECLREREENVKKDENVRKLHKMIRTFLPKRSLLSFLLSSFVADTAYCKSIYIYYIYLYLVIYQTLLSKATYK